ncbi:ABC transporter permease [Lachnospiraceae bacterium LCP25S3_G4]
MNDTLISKEQEKYLRSQHNHKRIIVISRFAVLVAFLLLWEISADLKWIDSFIFSSPSRVVQCFISMVQDKTIFLHVGVTLYETIISFILVIIISILFAILLWFSSKLSQILEPYMVVLNSLPKSALAPLLIVWLGANQTTIIVAGMSVAIFGSIMNLYTSFASVDPEEIKLIYTLHGHKFHALTKVVIPSCIPSIISIMKVNIGLCLVGVVIGEFLAARNGLGYLIIYSSQVFKLDWLLMSIVLLCIMAMGLYAFINFIEKCYQKKR